MKCNNCNNNINSNWKYCPNCSKKIVYKEKHNTLICIISIIICIFIFIFLRNYLPTTKYHIKRELYNAYNENFKKIKYLKKIDNVEDLDCDGSSFGVIRDGSKKYYKVYSKKNSIEFLAYFDTRDKEKSVYDTYSLYLIRRETILNIYDITKKHFKENNYKLLITYNEQKEIFNINSKEQLYDYLSKVNDNDIDKYNINHSTFSENIYISLNEDINEYIKKNINDINKINHEIIKLSNNYYFKMILLFNHDSKIELVSTNHKPQVYLKYKNNESTGTSLDDFIKTIE